MIDPKMYSGGSSLFPSASYIRYLLLFFYCFSFLLSELLLMLLPLCFMFFLFFTIKSPTCFFICFFFFKTSVKEKNKALTVSAFTRLFTVHQQSRCPTEIVMADWSLLFTGLNLIQMESPLGFTPTKFLRIWLKRKLPGSVGKLHDYEEVSCGPHRLGFQAPFAVESGGCGESLDS